MSHRLFPCASCGTLNRLPHPMPSGKSPKCGHCQTSLEVGHFVHSVTAGHLQKIIQNSPVPVVVDFWAPWCGPCLGFAPTFAAHAQQNPTGALYLKCDTEAEEAAGNAHRIRSIPTLILFREGQEKNRVSGALPAEGLRLWLAQGGVISG